MKNITLSRASVAMGDDIDAPHYMDIQIQDHWLITDIIKHIIDINYLPRISGGKATWSIAIHKPIGVVTQENPESPMLICLPDYPHQGTQAVVDIKYIHFNYHAQRNPNDVFEVLSRFKIEP